MKLGLSQGQLAELADVHRKTIVKIERGEQNITITNLIRLAGIFNRPLSEIMADTGLRHRFIFQLKTAPYYWHTACFYSKNKYCSSCLQ